MPNEDRRFDRWGALVVGYAGAVLAASGTMAATPTLDYAGWGQPFEIESINAEIEAFKRKYPGLGVEIRNVFVPWTGYHEKLVVQAAAGALPDVMLISGAFFRNIAVQNAFLDLTSYFERDGLRRDYLPPGSPEFLTVGGRLLGLPATGFAPGGAFMNYNADLFDNAGVPYPDDNWTWADLLERARKLTRDTNGDGRADVWGVDFGKTTWEAVWGYMFRAHCGQEWNADFSASGLNSDAGRFTFQFLKDLADRYQVSGGSGDDPFLAGQVAMSVAWSGQASRRLQTAAFRAGIAPMPKGPCGYGLAPPTGQVHVYAIARNTRYPDLAWRLVKFLVTEPEAVQARRLDAVASVAYRPLIPLWADKVPKALSEWWRVGMLYINNTPTPRFTTKALPSYDDQQAVLREELTRFYQGQVPVNTALANIERRLNELLLEAQRRAAQAASR